MTAHRPTPPPLQDSVRTALSHYFTGLNGHDAPPGQLYDLVLAQVEKPLINETLNYCKGNQSKAADVLGLNRATLRKKMAQYGLV